MTISQAAKTYADALIEVVKDGTATYDAILSDLNTADTILQSSLELQNALNTPVVAVEQKLKILDDVFKSEISPSTLNFLKILAEKKRFSEFGSIKAAYENKLDEVNGLKRLTITSAIELESEYRAKILDGLKEKLQKNISAEWKTDSSIIGGLVIRIEDNVIDTSIKNKLKNLSKNIIKGNL